MSGSWIEDLICPKCDCCLHHHSHSLLCSHCGSNFPFLGGTPIIVEAVSVGRHVTPPSRSAIEHLIQALSLPLDATQELTDIFSLQLSFSREVFQTESEQFVDRLRSSGIVIPPLYDAQQILLGKPVGSASSSRPKFDVELDVLLWPTHVLSGNSFSLTVILKNVGQSRISADGPTPFRLSFLWDLPPIVEGHRTELLIDLEPGRQISMPVSILAPAGLGPTKLIVSALLENSHWLLERSKHQHVTLLSGAADPLSCDWPRGNLLRDYNEDHVHALEILKTWVSSLALPRPARVLEIGGNFNPLVQHLGDSHALYNVDIDPFALMSLTLRNLHDGGRVRNLVADGETLPFRDEYFDVICMFATFHHFPDPITFLRKIRPKLRKDGFLALLCEPIGHVYRSTAPDEYIGELEKGVYEQSFALWEYKAFLEKAGYRICDALVDLGSLKLKAVPI